MGLSHLTNLPFLEVSRCRQLPVLWLAVLWRSPVVSTLGSAVNTGNCRETGLQASFREHFINTLATGAKLVPHLPGGFGGLFFGTTVSWLLDARRHSNKRDPTFLKLDPTFLKLDPAFLSLV